MPIARIPLNLYENWIKILISWSVIVTGSCFLPLIFYFSLKDGAHLNLTTVLAVTTSSYGASAIPFIALRTWSLAKRNSTSRPIRGSRWELDCFAWNSFLATTYLTIVCVLGNIVKPQSTTGIRVTSLPLTLQLYHVCSLILFGAVMTGMKARAPFPISSVRTGSLARPSLYAIVEDVVAVDGAQGTAFREAWNKRYLSSLHVRRLLTNLSWYWGVSGVAVAVALTILIFKLDNVDIGFALGWSIPWIWAALSALITIWWTKKALRAEAQDEEEHTPESHRIESAELPDSPSRLKN